MASLDARLRRGKAEGNFRPIPTGEDHFFPRKGLIRRSFAVYSSPHSSQCRCSHIVVFARSPKWLSRHHEKSIWQIRVNWTSQTPILPAFHAVFPLRGLLPFVRIPRTRSFVAAPRHWQCWSSSRQMWRCEYIVESWKALGYVTAVPLGELAFGCLWSGGLRKERSPAVGRQDPRNTRFGPDVPRSVW